MNNARLAATNITYHRFCSLHRSRVSPDDTVGVPAANYLGFYMLFCALHRTRRYMHGLDGSRMGAYSEIALDQPYPKNLQYQYPDIILPTSIDWFPIFI